MTLLPLARLAFWAAFWRLQDPMPPGEPQPWRLVTTESLHVGVRPHGDPGEGAVTIQLTFKTPW